MTSDRTVLTISGRLTFEHEISLGQAAKIIAFLDDPTADSRIDDLGAPKSDRKVTSVSSARDALASSGAKTNPERIVALALYVLGDGGKETFTVDDVRGAFRRARETVPGNMSRDFDAAMKAGWIAESDTKDEFYVVDQASRVLEEGFEALKRSRNSGSTRSRATSRRGRKPVETPAAFKDVDTISPKMDGVIDYHKLKTGGDKLLWAVLAAKSLGVPSVSNKDLVWLTDRLGSGIKSSDIAWCYRANQKQGYLNRSTQENSIRLTPDGETYMRSKVGEGTS